MDRVDANQSVVARIVAHHEAMRTEFGARVTGVARSLQAAEDPAPALARVANYLTQELLPHARAEEIALYPLGSGSERLRALVEAMELEHEEIGRAASEVSTAPSGPEGLARASAIQLLFEVHVRKENELLLPALANDPEVDLEAALAGMHRVLEEEDGGMPGASGEQVLDVRSLPPARRHGLIFATYEGLRAGETFILVNDHDPKPLYYQFAAEHPGAFSWRYLEEGPQAWRVRIGRT